jgi:murein DD-endopeptidase MepM/ murein hydrolase activator NlpD
MKDVKKWLILSASLLAVAAFSVVYIYLRFSGDDLVEGHLRPPSFSEPEPNGSGELCLTDKEYKKVTAPNAPVLSIPFDPADYSTEYWGIVPFCAKLRNDQIHGALDFELKPNARVLAAVGGVVTRVEVGRDEGSGEIIQIAGEGFSMDYSGLTNIQFKVGEKVKKGDYIANAVRIPHGEYHVHMGLIIKGKQECPLKYMDEEFLEAFKEMFSKADYRTQTDAPCACNCEIVTMSF